MGEVGGLGFVFLASGAIFGSASIVLGVPILFFFEPTSDLVALGSVHVGHASKGKLRSFS